MNLIGLIVGALVGTISTLVWQALLQPRLVGRSLAELLAVDLSIRMQAIAGEHLQRQQYPRTVPVRHPVPTAVFRAVIGRVAELPLMTVGAVVLTYQVFERLNETSDRANNLVDRYRAVEGTESKEEVLLDEQLTICLADYERLLASAVKRTNELQPLLLSAAAPWWSVRWFRAPKPQAFDAQTLVPKLDDLRTNRDAAAAAMRARK